MILQTGSYNPIGSVNGCVVDNNNSVESDRNMPSKPTGNIVNFIL